MQLSSSLINHFVTYFSEDLALLNLIDNGNHLYYSGEEKYHKNGVGFLIHKDKRLCSRIQTYFQQNMYIEVKS